MDIYIYIYYIHIYLLYMYISEYISLHLGHAGDVSRDTAGDPRGCAHRHRGARRPHTQSRWRLDHRRPRGTACVCCSEYKTTNTHAKGARAHTTHTRTHAHTHTCTHAHTHTHTHTHTQTWARWRKELECDALNRESLETIDTAIFVVCLGPQITQLY
jgi:uncharacterized protein YprB with RNaseH-like and TPR domain